jgi:hypothetical protein
MDLKALPFSIIAVTVVLSSAFGTGGHCRDDSPTCSEAVRAPLLLQLHRLNTSFSGRTQEIQLCGVQRNRCFDFTLAQEQVDNRQNLLPDTSDAHENLLPDKLVQIIITRAGEDLRWVDAFSDVPTTVYNRGGRDDLLPEPRPNLHIMTQQNTGREDEVMIRHIVDNYDALPAVTVFLQGWPFSHCTGIVPTVRRAIQAILEPPLMIQLNGSGSVEGMVPLSQSFWQYEINSSEIGLAKLLALRASAKAHEAEAVQLVRNLYSSTCSRLLGGKPCPNKQWAAEGSQWAVSRDLIRKTPKHLYKDMLSLGEGFQNKFRGLVLEALWPVLWGQPNWEPTGMVEVSDHGPAHRRLASSANHCHGDTGSQSQLFSCEDRVAFCELQQQKLQKNDAASFAKTREGFEIHGSTISADWSMIAEIQPVLWGSAVWTPTEDLTADAHTKDIHQLPVFMPTLTESNHELHLQSSHDTQAPALQWKFTEAERTEHGPLHYIYLPASAHQRNPSLYLSCDPVTQLARLSESPFKWRMLPVFSAYHRFESTSGRLNLLREDSGKLRCVEHQNVRSTTTSTFLLRTVVKKTGPH